jgi:hypothetical protein
MFNAQTMLKILTGKQTSLLTRHRALLTVQRYCREYFLAPALLEQGQSQNPWRVPARLIVVVQHDDKPT